MGVVEDSHNMRSIRHLKDMLEQSENLFGSKNAFLLKKNTNEYKGISFSEFKANVDQLGTAFIDLGLKGKHIAVIGENRYEWCVTYFAAAAGCGVIVPLDKELPLHEIQNLLERSEAAAVVFSAKLEDEISKLKGTMPKVQYFINMDIEEDTDGFLSFHKLLKKGEELISSGDRSFIDAQIDPNAMSTLLFTSGTTDLAKGVMLSHKNLCSNVVQVSSVIKMDSSDSILSILPLHHTYECTAGFLTMIYNGCCISFNEGLKHISKNLKEFKPTLLLSVPLILENMYKKIWDQASKKITLKYKLKAAIILSDFLLTFFKIDLRKVLFRSILDNVGGKLRIVISGAAAIDPDVGKGLTSMGINILQGYGLTECSPIVTVNPSENYRHDSIGKPLPGIEIKIDRPDEEGIGELVVKGNNVMMGYYNNPSATEKVLRDGWLYTGDLAYLDDLGFFYVTGRKKNVIVTKNGKNIFPEEVEAYLNKSPYILESLVWGKYDENSGETFVNAQIVPDLEVIKQKLKLDNPSYDDIYGLISYEVKAANKNMPLYKHVRSFTIREDEFAKTTTKKIKRYIVKTS